MLTPHELEALEPSDKIYWLDEFSICHNVQIIANNSTDTHIVLIVRVTRDGFSYKKGKRLLLKGNKESPGWFGWSLI